jgi:hypothetical protein
VFFVGRCCGPLLNKNVNLTSPILLALFHLFPIFHQLVDKYEAGSASADQALPEALTCFFLLKIPR